MHIRGVGDRVRCMHPRPLPLVERGLVACTGSTVVTLVMVGDGAWRMRSALIWCSKGERHAHSWWYRRDKGHAPWCWCREEEEPPPPRVVGGDSIKCMRLDGGGVTMTGKRLGGSKVNASRACIIMAVVGCRWGLCTKKGTLRDATLGALRSIMGCRLQNGAVR